MGKPRIGIYGITGCSGDQLVILNCEDELLSLVDVVEIVSFKMAQSNNTEGEIDVAFIEGSVIDPKDVELVQDVRRRSKIVVAIGTCAVWGGVPAALSGIPRQELQRKVYGTVGRAFKCVEAKPISAYVDVDYNITGCPIEKHEFLNAVSCLAQGLPPLLPDYSVCTECKLREAECLLVHQNKLCMGPITRAGCKARCPVHGIACIGCRGPVDEANVASEYDILKEKGFTNDIIDQRFSIFAKEAKAIVEKRRR